MNNNSNFKSLSLGQQLAVKYFSAAMLLFLLDPHNHILVYHLPIL